MNSFFIWKSPSVFLNKKPPYLTVRLVSTILHKLWMDKPRHRVYQSHSVRSWTQPSSTCTRLDDEYAALTNAAAAYSQPTVNGVVQRPIHCWYWTWCLEIKNYSMLKWSQRKSNLLQNWQLQSKLSVHTALDCNIWIATGFIQYWFPWLSQFDFTKCNKW